MVEKTLKENKSSFNPNEHLQDIKGKPYLPVAWRLVWFREAHPDWEIRTDIIEQDETRAIVKATISNDKGRTLATAHKKEDKIGFGDFLEKAETGSIGRCLALVAFGTQFSPDIDEGNVRIVDSPIELPKNASEGIVEAHKPIQTVRVDGISLAQKGKIMGLYRQLGMDNTSMKEEIKKRFNVDSHSDLTVSQASEWIKYLLTLELDKTVTNLDLEDLDSKS